MPSLFDSHDEFNEWFSKDIENAAENKGSRLNEHQLRRLHTILKPFMLRRVKRHVQNELSEKVRSLLSFRFVYFNKSCLADREGRLH
jgi:DNA helicase INO80